MRIFGIAQNRIATVLGMVGIAAAMLCLAPNASATTTATMDLTNAGGNIYDNVYIGPYTATITPTGSLTGTVTPVICDDFADDSYTPEIWTANVTNEASITASDTTLKFGTESDTIFGVTSNSIQLYNEAAWLANQLMAINPTNPAEANEATAIQSAIWYLLDPSGVTTNIYGFSLIGGDPSTCSPSNVTTATCWVKAAQGQDLSSSAGEFADVTIYSYANDGAVCPTPTNPNASCQNIPPQEFMVVTTPEPSTLLMLGLGLGAMFLMWRRQRNAGSSSMTAA